MAKKDLFLLKPQTFMNLSGESVQAAAGFYKIPPEHAVVFYDELDLPAGKLRVKQGGGNGGHNGLRSIDAHLGPDYWRVRIGIGHPGDKERVTGHVLSDFSKEPSGHPGQNTRRDCERIAAAAGRQPRCLHEQGGLVYGTGGRYLISRHVHYSLIRNRRRHHPRVSEKCAALARRLPHAKREGRRALCRQGKEHQKPRRQLCERGRLITAHHDAWSPRLRRWKSTITHTEAEAFLLALTSSKCAPR